MSNKHVIGKQIFEVECSSTDFPFALQQKISEVSKSELLPALNSLFDSLVSEEELICFDSLTVDIGLVDEKKELGHQIIPIALKEIKRQLLESQTHNLSNNALINDRNGLKVNNITHLVELWLYWLRYGALPPYSINPPNNWYKKILESLVIDNDSIIKLKSIVKNNNNVLLRLIYQHESSFLITLIEIFTGQVHKTLDEYMSNKAILAKQGEKDVKQASKLFQYRCWKTILSEVIINEKRLTTEAIKVIIDQTRYDVQNHNIELTNLESESISQFPHFIKNAGLILLHPFLNALFSKTNLIGKDQFNDMDCKIRAVLLLHYLASGEIKCQELDLIFPKILCALPLSFPIDQSIELSNSEKSEADNLLHIVIKRWGALGEVSLDALREGFLIREGKIDKTKSGLKVIVESKTLDILLDRLPWNLSIVKLPWLKHMIRTDWV